MLLLLLPAVVSKSLELWILKQEGINARLINIHTQNRLIKTLLSS